MIFLIEYNRRKGRIVTFKTFDESQRLKAENSRLDLEVELNRRGVPHEVVLLEAANKEALLQTHGRYFKNPSEIVKSASRDDKKQTL
jgi:hypothetical protein